MAVPIWLASFIPNAFNSVKEYVNRKQKISELKTEAALTIEQKKIEAEIRRVESADAADAELDKASIEDTGWKDEYLLIITTMPVVLNFLSPFVDLAFMVSGLIPVDQLAPGQAQPSVFTPGMLSHAVQEGFTSLSSAPEYYWYALGAVYIHSLGMRRMVRTFIEMFASKFMNK